MFSFNSNNKEFFQMNKIIKQSLYKISTNKAFTAYDWTHLTFDVDHQLITVTKAMY